MGYDFLGDFTSLFGIQDLEFVDDCQFIASCLEQDGLNYTGILYSVLLVVEFARYGPHMGSRGPVSSQL